jgi:uncharacterized membrane protein YgdD (TMEM256/DUF423 family)
MSGRTILLFGLLFMASGVLLGAFGAHMLKSSITPDLLRVWHTGVEYQFYHGLGMIGLGIWAAQRTGATSDKPRGATMCALLFVVGILLFSGSLYLLVLSGNRTLGMVTPFGGAALVFGWIGWAISLLKTP